MTALPSSLLSLGKSRLVPVALLAVFALLIVWMIGRESTWFDESYSLLLVGPHGFVDIAHRTSADSHPPLWYWVLKPWLELFGTTVVAARAQSAVFMLAAFAVWYHFLRTRFSRSLAVIALAMLVTNPMLLHYAVEARMYAFAILLVGLSCLLVTSRGRGRWFAYWPLAVAMLYVHYFLVFIIAGQFVFLLLVRREQELKVWWLIVYGLSIVLAFAPWLPFAVRQTTNIVAVGFWIPAVSWVTPVEYVAETFLHRLQIDLTGGVLPSLAYFVAWGASLIRAGRASAAGRVHVLLWCMVVVPWLLMFILSPMFIAIFNPRYVMFGLPALIALLVAGMLTMTPRWRAVVLAGMLAAQLWGIWRMGLRGYMPWKGFHSMNAVAAVVRTPIDGELPLVIATWQFTFFDAKVTLGDSQRVVMLKPAKPGFRLTDALYYDKPDWYVTDLTQLAVKHAWILDRAGETAPALPPTWKVVKTDWLGYCSMRLVEIPR